VVEEPESSLSLLVTGVDGKSTLLEHNKKYVLTAGLTENNKSILKLTLRCCKNAL